METQGKPRGPARKPDNDSVRRGRTVRIMASVMGRVDRARGKASQATWITEAIEDKLIVKASDYFDNPVKEGDTILWPDEPKREARHKDSD